jgi:site-specific DNA recombinase
MTTRATIYLRQSKDVEGTGAAVERQLEDCERLAAREGLTVVRTITDNDTSASSRKPRPGYDELLSDVEHGATDVIIAQTQDRLLRKPAEMESLIDLVERTGTRVMLVRAHVDLTTAMGRASARQAAVWARLEVEQKAERQVRQAKQSAERGQAPSRRAFGYRQDGATLDEAEAAVVRDAFARLFRGESLVKITAAMNAAGLPSVRGNRWSRKGTRYMLTSPRYAGWRVYHEGREDEVRVRGTWPTLITDDEHERAVELLRDPARRPAGFRGTARRWLGSGLFLCGRCGSDVRCGYRTQGGVRTYKCRAAGDLSRAAEPIDRAVMAAVCARLARPDAADLLAGGDTGLADLRAQADVLARRLDTARDRLDRGVLDEAEFVATKRTIKAEQAVAQRKITAAARTSVLATLGTGPDPAAAFAAADLAVQREVIDALCTVTLLPARRGASRFDPDTVRIDWRTA